jgi:hypothetical protein
MIADLLNRLPSYTDGGLSGLLAREAYVCRLCGNVAIRRDSWMDIDGAEFVRLECSMEGCPFTRTIVDPTPPRKPRKARVRKLSLRKNVPVHARD